MPRNLKPKHTYVNVFFECRAGSCVNVLNISLDTDLPYVYIYICMYIYIYIHTYIHTYIYIYIDANMYLVPT